MEGLTAKVFRTYNASITLQNQLNELTDPDASIAEKVMFTLFLNFLAHFCSKNLRNYLRHL